MGKIRNRKSDDRPERSVEELRGWLYRVIETELSKDESQIDYELIQECSDLDAYLTGTEIPLGDEEYKKALRQIQSKVETKGEGTTQKSTFPRRKKGRAAIRAAIIAAAVLVLMFSTISVVAVSQGLSPSEFISAHIKEILEMKPGDTIKGEQITLIKGETTATYSSPEEAVRALEVDILYPTVLPKDAKIKKVLVTNSGDPEFYEIIFVTDKTNEHRISVNNEILANPQNWPEATKHEINGITFYVLPRFGGHLAVAHRNGFEYQIFSMNREDLLVILNGLQPITP